MLYKKSKSGSKQIIKMVVIKAINYPWRHQEIMFFVIICQNTTQYTMISDIKINFSWCGIIKSEKSVNFFHPSKNKESPLLKFCLLKLTNCTFHHSCNLQHSLQAERKASFLKLVRLVISDTYHKLGFGRRHRIWIWIRIRRLSRIRLPTSDSDSDSDSAVKSDSTADVGVRFDRQIRIQIRR